jgi:glycosidase
MGARINLELDLDPPNETTLREMRMMLLHQFTFVSAPHIWNGDERGMWGADDPDCRKPIVWGDIEHRPQIYRPDGKKTKPISVKPNLELLDYYRILIAFRKQRPELVHGELEYTLVNDKAMILAYRRSMAGRETIVAFNRSDKSQIIRLSRKTNTMLKLLAESLPDSLARWKEKDSEICFELAPLSGVALGTAQ